MAEPDRATAEKSVSAEILVFMGYPLGWVRFGRIETMDAILIVRRLPDRRFHCFFSMTISISM